MRKIEPCRNCLGIKLMIDTGIPEDLGLQKMLDDNQLILYAANCEPKEFSYWIEKGNHYTMTACFWCPECGNYYFAGYCLYGRPVIKSISAADAKRWAESLEWGFMGSAYRDGE